MTVFVPPMDNTSTCEGREGTSSHESVPGEYSRVV